MAGSAGQEVARKILNKHMKKYNIIGFVDDDTKKYKLQVHGISVIGKTIDLTKSLNNKFDEIFICIPSATEAQMRKLLKYVSSLGKSFKNSTINVGNGFR